MLLALDTATRHAGLALYDGAQVVAELNWTSHDAQTVELLPRVDQCLRWAGLAPRDLSALAVNLGPGSFTGLRVALSLAKGMALPHGLPLIGVPGMDLTAYPHLGQGRPVAAVIAAGRGRCYCSVYRTMPAPAGDGSAVTVAAWQGWRSPVTLVDEAALPATLPTDALVAGELSPALVAALAAQGLAAASPAMAPRRAACLAELGWLRWQAGQVDDPAALNPIYGQDP